MAQQTSDSSSVEDSKLARLGIGTESDPYLSICPPDYTTIEDAYQFDESATISVNSKSAPELKAEAQDYDAYADTSHYFCFFERLPDELRTTIWTLVANFPRVVGVYERCHRDTTKIVSTTRPPALLSVCHESRYIGLSVYSRLDKTVHKLYSTVYSLRQKPIYINEDVDIIYRGKRCCLEGEAFRWNRAAWQPSSLSWRKKFETLCHTKTLAVDAVALTHRNWYPWSPYPIYCAASSMQDTDKPNFSSFVQMVIDCGTRGVSQLILVIGNDDDLTEVTLVPIETDPMHATYAERQVIKEVAWLQEALQQYRSLRDLAEPGTCSIPTIKIMTVQRVSLTLFPAFRKLPQELQNLVWKYAFQVPRVFTRLYETGRVRGIRPSAVGQACQESRRIMCKAPSYRSTESNQEPLYYNRSIDSVRFEIAEHHCYWRELRNYFQFGFNSQLGLASLVVEYKLGLGDYPIAQSFSASYARIIPNVREIIIVVGKPRAKCEMTLVPLAEAGLTPNQRGWVEHYVRKTRRDLRLISEKWRCLQNQQIKLGKQPSPDWTLPIVRTAYMKELSNTLSPYSKGGVNSSNWFG